MTRFQQEISGMLGEYWVKSANTEMERLVKEASLNATVEGDGAIRWNSNGNYLPDDCCEILEYAGFNFSRKATKIKRDIQSHEQIIEYKKAMKNYEYSDEEIAEMRAAFGSGTTVVNVITGKTFLI